MPFNEGYVVIFIFFSIILIFLNLCQGGLVMFKPVGGRYVIVFIIVGSKFQIYIYFLIHNGSKSMEIRNFKW
jgi:hypothetical protein